MRRSELDRRSHSRGANAVSADFDAVERRRSRYPAAGLTRPRALGLFLFGFQLNTLMSKPPFGFDSDLARERYLPAGACLLCPTFLF